MWWNYKRYPLTINGKIDKKALPDPDASSLLMNEYVAPCNELEEQLSIIWKELLGVKKVGINDNFFELGGDSIITIQVVSRSRRLGYVLHPKDLFTYQTIAQLSDILANRKNQIVFGEQGLLTGSSGMLPIQQWFFHQNYPVVSHYNQSILLGISKDITPSILESVLKDLMRHHDALRFKYTCIESGWEQEYGVAEGRLVIDDLQASDNDSMRSLIAEKSNYYQASLDIEKGELIQVVLMQTPKEESQNRLLLIIHHLAVDGVSWRILLDDLTLLLSAMMKNEKVSLSNKTSSYRQYYNALMHYAKE